MFDRILVANRGEIACRVMATARRLGIATVTIFSSADRNARHVAMADEAIHVGGAAASESYLRGPAIIEAALRTGAKAIHPGYGFLSENPDFAEAVEAAGLTFIGPPASAIRAMGLKDAAKALMDRAGVPIVPGWHGESLDPALLFKEAERIGYPVLIKARAGGGGKGMRLVERSGDFHDSLEGAMREAEASFGDPHCLIERYITSPRHVEIQVLADTHGHVVHLFERDCSLQRRHQKVIEEAPAPGMSAEMRAAMGRAAVEAARAIGYAGAGTVEFIADGTRGLRPDGFWFMEMNTRLQVEHPVTEAITGLDLVEWQLRIAAGASLPFVQDDLAIDGHAFEARICAEDVTRGFLPATGQISHLAMPPHAAFEHSPVRIDSGVVEGDSITPHYDPMIAKLIVHGETREDALARLISVLGMIEIAGTTTNLALLRALARHDGFARGEVDTGLIARDLDRLVEVAGTDRRHMAIAAIVSLGLLRRPVGTDPWYNLVGWRQWSTNASHIRLERRGNGHDFVVSSLGGHRFEVACGGWRIALSVRATNDHAVECELEGHVFHARLAIAGEHVTIFLDGDAHGFDCPDPLAGEDEPAEADDGITAPMPGLVKLVGASEGERVMKGQRLFVLEAMKMEHTLVAPRDGIVEILGAAEGDQVEDGTLLLRLRSEETGDG
ncbi:MAG: acetyl/propionyl/methylcrotonyl-CoA carboxylase subunit alpha [Geminicoccaceae bacterium]|nr:acetyl/propionyl/methylcrotonyl-CoA carboxylase subunit alpha [Geminicoccaceae bacterium]